MYPSTDTQYPPLSPITPPSTILYNPLFTIYHYDRPTVYSIGHATKHDPARCHMVHVERICHVLDHDCIVDISCHKRPLLFFIYNWRHSNRPHISPALSLSLSFIRALSHHNCIPSCHYSPWPPSRASWHNMPHDTASTYHHASFCCPWLAARPPASSPPLLPDAVSGLPLFSFTNRTDSGNAASMADVGNPYTELAATDRS